MAVAALVLTAAFLTSGGATALAGTALAIRTIKVRSRSRGWALAVAWFTLLVAAYAVFFWGVVVSVEFQRDPYEPREPRVGWALLAVGLGLGAVAWILGGRIVGTERRVRSDWPVLLGIGIFVGSLWMVLMSNELVAVLLLATVGAGLLYTCITEPKLRTPRYAASIGTVYAVGWLVWILLPRAVVP
jgi:hypothetical protein